MGVLCQRDNGGSYNWCRKDLLELVRNNLEREETKDEASQMEHETTKKLFEKLGTDNLKQVIFLFQVFKL